MILKELPPRIDYSKESEAMKKLAHYVICQCPDTLFRPYRLPLGIQNGYYTFTCPDCNTGVGIVVNDPPYYVNL